MNSFPVGVACLFGAAAFLGLTPLSTPAAALRGGMAKVDITPKQPVLLGGYASRTNLSQGIHDPLSARAVAFEQDGRRLVLISLDNLGFYNGTAEPMRQAVIEGCRLQPSELFLSAIHTHSAPILTLASEKDHPHNVEYSRTLRGKLVEVARLALNRMTPVQVVAGSGSSPVGVNRREAVRDSGGSRVVLGRNPSALIDREVQVIKLTRTESDELIGVLFAYATHSTSLGPRNHLISGDVHGLAEQFLEGYLGAGVVAPAFAGASGNIDPWYRVLPGFNTTNGWIPEPVLLGTLLGQEVAHVLKGMRTPAVQGTIRTAMRTLELPRKATSESPNRASAAPAPFVITVGCIGDVAFAGLGGEVFSETGQAIKTASPFPHTLIITHCNAAGGYLPPRPSHAEGGYEVQSSPFAPGAAEAVVEETMRLLRDLRQTRD